MSQSWKQTKLDMGVWNRPVRADDQEPARDTLSAAIPASRKRSMQASPLASSPERKSTGESSPSSDEPSSPPSPRKESSPRPSILASDAENSREAVFVKPSSNIHAAVPKAAGLSFTSSQLLPSSSSQRIVRDGERMVTNSDEDDDSSSLEDLDDVFRKKPTIPDRLPQPVNKIERRAETTKRDSTNGKAVRMVSTVRKAPNYKYSLAALAEQRKQLQNSEADVAKVNASLEGRRHAPLTNGEVASLKGLPHEGVIDAAMAHAGDEQEVDRLKEALRRTEALHQDPAWSFFHTNVHLNTDTSLEFPSLQDHPLQAILRNTSSRQQAFLNGYIEDYAMKHDLPDELLDWILESSYSEKREDLRLAYVQVLSEVGSAHDLLTPHIIDKSFRCMGARGEALDMGKPISPSFTAEGDAGDVISDRLPSTLTLIKNLSSTLKSDSRVHAICILCRLLLDNHLVYNCNVMTALDETLNSLIESIPNNSHESELSQALRKVYDSVADPKLRLQLVSHLPVYDFRTAMFRRRLALAFFYDDTEFLIRPATKAMIDLDSLTRYLQTPPFKISRNTDYAALTSALSLLDIGIDGADPPLPFTSKKDEKNFDEAVDRLSMRLKDISSQIIGASALDMRRTEAKEILHAMQRRLTYAVRSEPYVKKSFLAKSETDFDSEKKAMSEYLNSTKTGVADNPHVGAAGVV